MPNADSVPRGLPLVAYAENLCKGARVLVVAGAPLPLAEAVVARGARLVHVFEADRVRRAEMEARNASADITFGAPGDWRHEGVFDLVLVENLGLESDPDKSMRSFAKLLAPRGSALISAPNPETRDPFSGATGGDRALDYYALYSAVSAALPHVRMLGQVPFAGYALIDFAAEGEPAPVFDTSLLPARGEEPGYFVAFGSRQPQELEGYVVIQVPAASVVPRGVATPARQNPPGDAPAAVAAAQVAIPVPPAPAPAARAPAAPPPGPSPREKELELLLKKQEAWIAELEARASVADERADAAESELEELREQATSREQTWTQERTASADEATSGRAELERLRRRTNELDEMLEVKTRELAAARAEVTRLEGALALSETKIRAVQAERQSAAEELAAASTELGAARAELAAARGELTAARAELTAAADEASVAVEVSKLEGQLLEQGHKIRGLERDLREAERTGRELVRKLSAQRVTPSAAVVAERLVEAEAELVSLRWSLQMLGRAEGSAPTTSHSS